MQKIYQENLYPAPLFMIMSAKNKMSKTNQNNQESNPRLFKKWCGVGSIN